MLRRSTNLVLEKEGTELTLTHKLPAFCKELTRLLLKDQTSLYFRFEKKKKNHKLKSEQNKLQRKFHLSNFEKRAQDKYIKSLELPSKSVFS